MKWSVLTLSPTSCQKIFIVETFKGEKTKSKWFSSRIRIRHSKSIFNFSLRADSCAEVGRVKMRSHHGWKNQEEVFSHYGGAGYWPYIGDMLCPYIIICAHPVPYLFPLTMSHKLPVPREKVSIAVSASSRAEKCWYSIVSGQHRAASTAPPHLGPFYPLTFPGTPTNQPGLLLDGVVAYRYLHHLVARRMTAHPRIS